MSNATTPLTEGTPPKEDKMAKARAAKFAKREAQITETVVGEETVEQRRQRLTAELASLPPDPTPDGLKPGTVVGEGPAARKVPFTRSYFEKNYEMVRFIPPEDGQATLNGVTYAWKRGKEVSIPSPHYSVWKDAQERLELGYRMYDPPADLKTNIPGYTSPVFRMGEGLMDPIPTDEQK